MIGSIASTETNNHSSSSGPRHSIGAERSYEQRQLDKKHRAMSRDGTSTDSLFSSDYDDPNPDHRCEFCPYLGMPYHQLSSFGKLRRRLHWFFDDPASSKAARFMSFVIIFCIIVSTFALCLETIPPLADSDVWFYIDGVVTGIFTFEYIGRLLTSSRLHKWWYQPLNLIDLIAIIPFYVEVAAGASNTSTLRVFRVVRLARIFRLFKVSRYSSYMQVVGEALKRSADAFLLLLFFLAIGLVIFSALLFFAEQGTYDEALDMYIRDDGSESPYESIPGTFYWCIVTMTTVGYGDHTPVTIAGKIIASITMICGILVIAMPITILGGNFQSVYSEYEENKKLSQYDRRIERQLETFRKARGDIEESLGSLRAALRDRISASELEMWSTIDQNVTNGLMRMEELLNLMKLQEDTVTDALLKSSSGNENNSDAAGLLSNEDEEQETEMADLSAKDEVQKDV